jgi:all-trans-retinol dehydrogenase (NAD+)
MTDIRGKNVLVTGAARGMGRGLSEALVARGARVVLLDIDKDALEALAAQLGAGAKAVVADMSRVDDIYRAAAEAEAAFSGIDILVNNAGVVAGGTLCDVSEERHTLTFMVNTLGVTRMTRAILPGMMQRRSGHIVNVSSASALVGVPKLTTYAASKWAVLGFSESLQQELADQGLPITVTSICPSYVNTGMFDGVKAPMLMPLLEPDEVVRAIITAIEKDTRLVMMPPAVNLVPWMRALLPERLRDFVLETIGINRSMSDWRGHGK